MNYTNSFTTIPYPLCGRWNIVKQSFSDIPSFTEGEYGIVGENQF
jgi:hypothetical protein